MKTIKETIDHYKKQGIASTDKHLCEVIDIIEEQYIDPIKGTHPEIHWDTMREIHEVYCGAHYDEAFAKYEVEKMSHKGADGMEYKGQHWSMEQVQPVYSKYKQHLKSGDNVYDMYVALNSFYHDNCTLYKAWFGDKYEEHIIEGAINYFFKDMDAPDGKIWYYYNGMREGM